MNAHSFNLAAERIASVEEASAAQCHQPRTGLTATEVLALRAEHGRNELPAENPTSAWAILFSQFKSWWPATRWPCWSWWRWAKP